MSNTPRALPTLERLGSTVDPNLDALPVANAWFSKFTYAVDSKDAARVIDLLVDDAFWRDMLALTWDFRTYEGKQAIHHFLADQLPKFQPSAFQLRQDSVALQFTGEGIAWIHAAFTFDTTVGHASGIFRLVPLPDGTWKAYTVYTNLEDLKGYPEKLGHLRDHQPSHGKWVSMREREQKFVDGDPTVVIIGGSQTGLVVAARLKMLGISSVVLERTERVGDNWRNRYACLSLHDSVWYNHMPYLPFPSSWPVYIPAAKLANWLEFYAEALELNVWTSTNVTLVEQGTKGKRWSVKVSLGDGAGRVFETNHVVFAVGFGGGPKIPDIPGQDDFKGQVLHTSQHKCSTDHLGKEVVVIGACTSAHDVCSDYVDHGVSVTMVQRSPTYVMSTKAGIPGFLGGLYNEVLPTDVADRTGASLPTHVTKLLFKSVTKAVAEADKDILDGLRRVGFQLSMGPEDSGPFLLVWTRGGGYYFDAGASQKIIDGKIKVKNDSLISKFTSTGLLFEDGSKLDADVIVFATGYRSARDTILQLLPSHLHDKVQPVWGITKEGEINNMAGEIGGRGPEGRKLAGLWMLIGNLALGRFHSKHLALQIKAYEEGIRY